MAGGGFGSMRYPEGELPILSAEIYDAGLPSRRRAVTRKAQTHASGDAEDVPRKRARTQTTEASEPEDEKKRSRGRPRLDTKDETAADRRRTQIRLAQRAYRNRKENAIQTLEKQVQQLKGTNEEMSNAFLQLHDFAVASGLLDKMPEFGRQLRETTEKFLSLARDASDDDPKDGESAAGSNSNTPVSPAGGHGQDAGSDGSEQSGRYEATATPTEKGSITRLSCGLTISHEPVEEADFTQDLSTNFTQPPAAPYEVVTYPTLANASFSFQAPPSFDPLNNLPISSPWAFLPAPTSYSAMEMTFGRRLQRYALERALILICMPNAPQESINRVFGFCLLIETVDAIKRRLRRQLGHSAQENLSNWQFPFFHLGGAGTHIDTPSAATAEGQRFGNQGTLDILKPRETTGFSTGPFSADITGVRDQGLDKDMRISAVPGFEGEYFDCDETEMYLYQRGVIIPPGADVITADIDPSRFSEAAWEANPFLEPSGERLLAAMSGSPPSSSSSLSSTGSGATITELTSLDGSTAPWSMPDGTGLVDPTLTDGFSIPSTTAASYPAIATYGSTSTIPATSTTTTISAFNPLTAYSNPFALNTPLPDLPRPSTDVRQRVVIDVQILVKELCKRAVCLGRTPGIRPSGINAAFWASVQASR